MNTMKSYALENDKEFERLERQSQCESYNFEMELQGFNPKQNGTILDAGSGSGIVSRYLAKRFNEATVVGCDFSLQRVVQASEYSKALNNLSFKMEDLTQLSFSPASFDAIVCRYVVEHLSQSVVGKAFSELYRCIKPNGIIRIVDIDGYLYNIFPRTELMEKVFAKVQGNPSVNFCIGRQIPDLLAKAGFTSISWKIETMQFRGESLQQEIQMVTERFQNALNFLTQITGSESESRQFIQDYLKSLQQPNAVLFYNKFLVDGVKNTLKKVT